MRDTSQQTSQSPDENIKPSTVLVVDDEHEFRKLLVRILELEGFKVVAASEALEALDILQNSVARTVQKKAVEERRREEVLQGQILLRGFELAAGEGALALRVNADDSTVGSSGGTDPTICATGADGTSPVVDAAAPPDTEEEDDGGAIDIALLDVALPGMNGMTLFSRMQQDERLRQIPVIFLTGDLKYESKERAFEAGAVDYITKPFQKKELIVRLRAHIRERRQREREQQDAAGLTSEAELSLEEAEQRFSAVVRNSFHLICELDAELNMIYVSPNHPEVLVLAPEVLMGKRWEDHLQVTERDEVFRILKEISVTGADKRTLIQFKDGTGHWRWLDLCASRFFTRQGAAHILLVSRDITHAKETERYLQHLALHDSLTGLANRQRFTDELEEIVAGHPQGAPYAVIYADVDNFKLINDRHGHFIGDQVLRDVGSFLKRAFEKEAKLISRFGGDEFCVIIHAQDFDRAQAIGERMCEVIASNPILSSGERHRITLSMGIAQVDADLSVKEVLSRANTALHVAKSSGKNRCCVYHSESSELVRIRHSAEWFQKIQEALETSRFIVLYQPIVDLDTGRIAHSEALIRFQDEDGHLHSPAAFLPSAERYGLMSQIDRYVVSRVFSDMAANPTLKTSINLSGCSVTEPSMVSYIEQCFDESGIEPSRIVFEITETVFMTNLVQAREMVERMQDLGCAFGLDDFGSGFSSLNYLRNLPVNVVKIDGSFVREIEADAVSRALLKSINEIAHLLGKATVAEWVESAETCRILRSIGVDYAQGYYCGKPQALELLLPQLTEILPTGRAATAEQDAPTEELVCSKGPSSSAAP